VGGFPSIMFDTNLAHGRKCTFFGTKPRILERGTTVFTYVLLAVQVGSWREVGGACASRGLWVCDPTLRREKRA